MSFWASVLRMKAEIYQALELIKETGLLTSFHAENQPLIDLFVGRMRRQGAAIPWPLSRAAHRW
ncbi:MAG: hypothetical protein R2867_15430 [Caldilineaceae bacterium]